MFLSEASDEQRNRTETHFAVYDELFVLRRHNVVIKPILTFRCAATRARATFEPDSEQLTLYNVIVIYSRCGFLFQKK